MRILLITLLFIVTACTASDDATTSSAAADSSENVAANPDAIDFSLPVLGGGTLTLSDLRGQWVIANYWATWCAPCRKEIPELDSLHAEREDVTVLGLAYEEVEPEAFLVFLEKYPATYPILITDTFNPPEALGQPLALPTTFLVNPEGVIVERFIGPVTREELEEAITDHS